MANNNAPGQYNRNSTGGAANELGINGVTNPSGIAVTNLSDIRNFLQPTNISTGLNLSPGECSYDHLVEMIRGLDLQDDGIRMNHKMKAISEDFCVVVRDENMLCECMDYINDKALADGEMALKFALLFSSHNFDQLAMKDIKIRSAMLKVLEANYLNADTYRIHDKDRLYNSITLLGEYYNRVRLADQSPITILGQSLLTLLLREVSALDTINVKLAKLILSQITLNGDIMRANHNNELTQLLYHIRRNLIEQPALSATVKALLLMTLDLYYSNFTNLGAQLEEMYTKYLVQDVEDEGNNNNGLNVNVAGMPQPITNPTCYRSVGEQQPPTQQQQQQHQHQQPQQTMLEQQNLSQINSLSNYTSPQTNRNTNNSNNALIEPQIKSPQNGGDVESAANNSFETLSTKKWSEQVCEDSMYESEFGKEFNSYEQELKDSSGEGLGGMLDSGVAGRLSNGRDDVVNVSSIGGGNLRYNSGDDSSSRSARRSQKPRNQPRPLKQQQHESVNERDDGAYHQLDSATQQYDEEQDDETKPLPRWRAPRFNRENDAHANDRPQHNQHRRYSANFDDDVRSDGGGSIRLYSINDRLRHSQEKMERSGGNFNSIANSNWDRQSQHGGGGGGGGGDDRSERSYISNYERGNNYRRGNRAQYNNNNNRQNYDKPPRFLKQQQQQQRQQRDNSHNIHSNSWRQSRSNSMNNSSHHHNDEQLSSKHNNQHHRHSNTNGPESNSRSSSRARTLPRPRKSRQFEDNIGPDDDGAQQHSLPPQSHNRGSQSPTTFRQQRSRNFSSRYSSQSSLASEASSTLDRRNNHQRHRNFNRQSQKRQDHRWQEAEGTNNVRSQQQQGDDNGEWQANGDESELVRNARQTAKYMNYLASKK